MKHFFYTKKHKKIPQLVDKCKKFMQARKSSTTVKKFHSMGKFHECEKIHKQSSKLQSYSKMISLASNVKI